MLEFLLIQRERERERDWNAFINMDIIQTKNNTFHKHAVKKEKIPSYQHE